VIINEVKNKTRIQKDYNKKFLLEKAVESNRISVLLCESSTYYIS